MNDFYERNVIDVLDGRDNATAVFNVLDREVSTIANQLAIVTHHSSVEWFATIVKATMEQIGHEDQIA